MTAVDTTPVERIRALEIRADKTDERLDEYDDRFDDQDERIDRLSETQGSLATDFAVIKEQMKNINRNVSDTKDGVAKVNDKLDQLNKEKVNLHYVEPLKRWQSIALVAISVIVTAFANYFLRKAGIIP